MALDLDQIFANAPLVEDPPKKQPWELAFEKHFNVQPTSAPIVSQPNKAQLLLQPYLDKGLDPAMAIEAANHARTNQVNTAVNMGMDMVNHNPIGALTMDPDKFRKKVQDSGTAFGTNDVVDEAAAEIKKTVPVAMGEDWFKRQYDIKDGAVSVASDVHDEIGEQLTKDAYDYSGKFLSDADRKMVDINQQIKVEKEKTTEEGYDVGKIHSLQLQLSALGKTYTDENGDVIDVAKATPAQKEYMKTVDGNVIELTKLKESDGGDKKLKDAYFEQYKFVRALDELYDSDVDPWLQTQIKAQASPVGLAPAVAAMPKSLQQIVDQRRSATAQLAALSKVYFANHSPADIKKNFKYYAQSAAKGFGSGLMGRGAVSALQDELGPTERDMLDAAQSIMNSKGLDISPETQKTFDRSIGEYAVEGGSQMMGMLPLLGVVGGATGALKVASGLEKLTTAWKAGGDIAKVGATMVDMAVEELKLAGVGFAPGTGSGFVLSGKALPNIQLKNPIANAVMQFMVKPAIITSSMYGARVTESMVESMFSYKDFNDILTEKFGNKKELIGTALSNFMFGFGNKSVAPDKYKEMLDHATELRKTGKLQDAVWLEQQVGTYKKMDKASGKAYRKGVYEGLTQDQIYEKMKSAESEAAGKAAAATQVTLEQQNLLERTVPSERLSIVMKGSKMRDADGNLQVYWHGTDQVFNRFSKVGNKTSTGGKANSRSGRLTFFAENPDMAKSFGANTERRYLNFKKPIEVGNVRKLNDVKIADLEKQGYDGITGWETINGVKEKVAAAFGTQGIVKAEELLPFKSKNAETLRSWADQLRSKELRMPNIIQGGAPLGMSKFEKKGLEVMAKTLEVAGDVVEALAKGVAYIQEQGWYQKMTPELKAKFDPEIKARLQKLLEDSRPEAVAKYDLERATKMSEEVKAKYLPEFTKQGEAIANDLGGKFISDVKKPESTVAKKNREGLADVVDVQDAVRGVLVVKDLSESKAAAKKLKEQGYSISNKRVPNKETGYRGITATKREGELGSEIQIHTEQTWENQQKAQALWNNWRDMNKENPVSPKIKSPDSYYNIDGIPKQGSVDLSTPEKPESKFAEPHTTYAEANGAAVHSKAKNLWIKPDGGVENSKRVLMGQFTSNLMGGKEDQAAKDVQYFNSVYSKVPGYTRTKDFWEIPLWQAKLRGSFKNADSYIIRDVAEAKEFIEKSGYKEVAFSVLDVTREKVKELADLLPDVNFNLGGYTDMSTFKDNPNIKIFNTIEDMAKAHNVPYSPTFDYAAFKGSTTIPRLEMSMGCKHSCAFCQVSKDNPFAEVDKKVIDAQLEGIKELKPTYIYLNDKTFGQASNYQYLEELNGRMKKDNPNFEGFIIQTTAAAMKKTLTPEFIDAAGIKFIEIGVESYNNDVLKAVNKPSNEKLIDEAVEMVRKTQAKLIPNIVVGIKEETAQTYENTLAFLEKNKDVISHANIYNLGVNEKNAAALGVDIGATTDMDQNVSGKTFHANPELHAEYYNKFLEAAKQIVEVNGPKMQYEQAMTKSKALYDEAYSGLEDINLEGSPAKTPLEKKMAAMELPVSVQKELNKSWTETKQKLLAGARDESTAIQEQFKSFIDGMQIGKLGIPLKKGMLKIVNKIDANKPVSLENAIDYFDKVVGDASFKYEVIATQKVLNNLDQRTSEAFLTKKNSRGLLVNKVGPSGLPLHDELKSIRKDMTEGDWNQGQAEIQKIMDKYANEDSPMLSLEDYNKLTRENFKGLLNNTNGADRMNMEGALRDLKDIIKTGKSEAAARQMIMKAQMDEHNANVFRILTANGKKPVKTGSMEKANVTEKNSAHLLMWYKTSNWDSLMDIFSQYDSDKYMGKGKGSDPGKSIISQEMVGSVRDAAAAQHQNTSRIHAEVQRVFKESLGVKTDSEIIKAEKKNSTELHTITYKNQGDSEKSLTMTRNQALKVWMELQDPTLQKSNESPSYKEELVGDRLQKVEEHDAYMRDGELTDLGKKVTELVTPELQKWGQWQLDHFYPEYWSRINEVYRNKFGLDMPLNQKYSPIFVAGKFGESKTEMDNLLSQQNIISTSTNANLISRTAHGQKLALMDANKVMMNYIDKMEFFINWTDALDLTNGTFMRNTSIREAIKQNFGKAALQTVEATIKDFGRAPRDVRYAGQWINTIKNNLTVASLALKPNVFFSQLSSQPAYIDKIGVKNWVANNPFNNWEGTKKAFNDMKDSEYWKMRYGEGGGWDWTVMERMREDVNKLGGSTKWQELKNQSMFLTKYGDMFSVITGGIPVYKYYYDKVLRETGNETFAKTIAIREFADITDKSQQAGHVYDLSQVQRDPILKMATMYATAGMQYHRNVTTAFRNGLLHTFDPEARRGSYANNLKTLVMYHVVLPSLYQLAANGFQWDNKDQLRAAVLGNFSEVFVAGDILTGLMNSIRGLPFDYQFSPLENIVVVGKKSTVHATTFAKSIADEVDGVMWDQLGKAAWDAAQVIGSVTGTPVNAVESKIAAVDDIMQGKTQHPVGRIIGWSESVMSGNIGTIKDNETLMDINKFKSKNEEPLPPVGGHKPLPTPKNKPLPGGKLKPLPTQKVKPLPKN